MPDSGAIGRLSEAERDEILEAVWSWEAADESVFAEDHVLPVVERIVCEHINRALAEVEQRIATSVPVNFELRPDGRTDPQAAAYVEGLRDAHAIVRAARQEQSR